MPVAFILLVGITIGMVAMLFVQKALREGAKAKRAALARERVRAKDDGEW